MPFSARRIRSLSASVSGGSADLANDYIIRASRYPTPITETEEGDSCDMEGGTGTCFSIQVVGVVTGTDPVFESKLQEWDGLGSSDWADIPGAVFSTVTAAVNLQVINFERTKRYVRQFSTISGTNPSFTYCCLIGQQMA